MPALCAYGLQYIHTVLSWLSLEYCGLFTNCSETPKIRPFLNSELNLEGNELPFRSLSCLVCGAFLFVKI